MTLALRSASLGPVQRLLSNDGWVAVSARDHGQSLAKALNLGRSLVLDRRRLECPHKLVGIVRLLTAGRAEPVADSNAVFAAKAINQSSRLAHVGPPVCSGELGSGDRAFAGIADLPPKAIGLIFGHHVSGRTSPVVVDALGLLPKLPDMLRLGHAAEMFVVVVVIAVTVHSHRLLSF
ncbi:hypothetical protein [Methylobacterium thuringiense]|uniref:hypothetical protein n=1 Tax=Methylobacterium thuringiense TaxID=1003091 RepID=UPI001EDF3EC0|nr:hypothetical protein [Methylobacterium thuringiense]